MAAAANKKVPISQSGNYLFQDRDVGNYGVKCVLDDIVYILYRFEEILFKCSAHWKADTPAAMLGNSRVEEKSIGDTPVPET